MIIKTQQDIEKGVKEYKESLEASITEEWSRSHFPKHKQDKYVTLANIYSREKISLDKLKEIIKMAEGYGCECIDICESTDEFDDFESLVFECYQKSGEEAEEVYIKRLEREKAEYIFDMVNKKRYELNLEMKGYNQYLSLKEKYEK